MDVMNECRGGKKLKLHRLLSLKKQRSAERFVVIYFALVSVLKHIGKKFSFSCSLALFSKLPISLFISLFNANKHYKKCPPLALILTLVAPSAYLKRL